MSALGQEETSRSTSLLLYGRARVGIALGRRNHEAGAWKMHTDLADRGFAASDDDLMDVQGDQFADDRIASGIVRSNADDLAGLPADGIFRVSGCFRDRGGASRYIEGLFGGHWAPPAVADCGNPLGPIQQPWKAIERRR